MQEAEIFFPERFLSADSLDGSGSKIGLEMVRNPTSESSRGGSVYTVEGGGSGGGGGGGGVVRNTTTDGSVGQGGHLGRDVSAATQRRRSVSVADAKAGKAPNPGMAKQFSGFAHDFQDDNGNQKSGGRKSTAQGHSAAVPINKIVQQRARAKSKAGTVTQRAAPSGGGQPQS